MDVSDRQLQLLSSASDLEKLAERFAGVDTIAVDTEFNRTNTYRAQLCLVQLSANGDLALVDVLSEPPLAALQEIVLESRAMKLFHAAKQDMEALYQSCGLLPNRMLDTQIAASLIGRPAQVGYANLVEDLLGIQLDKSATRTDWSRRPLSPTQLSYAAADVLYLFDLHNVLVEKLEAQGRYAWALEDSARLLDPSLYEVVPEDAWQRIPSIKFLPVGVQARARALAAWREKQAMQINRPRQWVLSDVVILKIAQDNPATTRQLANAPDIPPAVVRKQGEKILAALQDASAALDRGELNIVQRTRSMGPDPAAVKGLARILRRQAERAGIAPEILATRRELVGLLQGELEQRVTQGWRRELAGEALLAAL